MFGFLALHCIFLINLMFTFFFNNCLLISNVFSRMTLVSLLPLAHPALCGNLYLANLGVPSNVFKAGVNTDTVIDFKSFFSSYLGARTFF